MLRPAPRPAKHFRPAGRAWNRGAGGESRAGSSPQDVGQALALRREAKRDGVDTVAQPARRRAVVTDVPLLRATKMRRGGRVRHPRSGCPGASHADRSDHPPVAEPEASAVVAEGQPPASASGRPRDCRIVARPGCGRTVDRPRVFRPRIIPSPDGRRAPLASRLFALWNVRHPIPGAFHVLRLDVRRGPSHTGGTRPRHGPVE